MKQQKKESAKLSAIIAFNELERLNTETESKRMNYEKTKEHRENFLSFVQYTFPAYMVNWHHRILCSRLDELARGELKRLMVFMPPQHGKSELVSRRFPVYMLGRNPKLRFVGASYTQELADSFNRDAQRIVEDTKYSEVFPPPESSSPQDPRDSRDLIETLMSGKFIKRGDMFETEGYGGYYKSVGVGGSLTGFSADILSIDDPVKGPEQAFSETNRRNVWDWYTDVVETRLHNNSSVLLTMTRWHEDDLAGRLLAIEPEKWTVVSFPAFKEDNSNPDDQRSIGEPLWPEKHSAERLNDIRKKSERTFTSLYQQRPAPEEGNIIKKQWFRHFYLSELPPEAAIDFYTDTAYGKENSDNSATMCYSVFNGDIYIRDMWTANLTYPAFKRAYTDYIIQHGYNSRSECVFEPKASGISIVQDLKETVLEGGQKINVIEDTPPKDDKHTRVMASSPVIESGRVFLLTGSAWAERFLEECASFPSGKFDDQVDCLSGVILRRFKKEYEPSIKRLD